MDAEAQQVFRAEARAWLRANMPAEPLPPITADGSEQADYLKRWQRVLFEGGWAGINWPKDYGGRGLSWFEEVIWYEEYARIGAPNLDGLFVGLQHAGPILILHGTDEQKAFHLPPILKGEHIWCQGFSEPGAGSDLSALRCRGDIEGDHIVINGSKIWTSFAQRADYQELIVRTEPGSIRHKGLSWLICDMRTPGITVRPIRSLDGQYHNTEVFYDNVRVPIANVVGGLGNGWAMTIATLAFERGTGSIEPQMRLATTVAKLLDYARGTPGLDGRPLIEDGAVAQRLGDLKARAAGLRAMTYLGAQRTMKQAVPGAESTYVALTLMELKQEVYRAWMDLFGPYGLDHEAANPGIGVIDDYLFSYAGTIGGGTSEVRRNIIAERILGLPKHDAVAP